MSEPQVLSMEAIRNRAEIVDAWTEEGLKQFIRDLIATVRAKDAALSELAGIYEAHYGALNRHLREQLNEAIAVIREISDKAPWFSMTEGSKKAGELGKIARDFLTKHQDSPTRANDQTTSG